MSASTLRRSRVAQVRPIPPTRSPWTVGMHEWSRALADAGKSSTTIAGYVKHVGWLGGDLAHLYADPWEVEPDALSLWLDNQRWSAATRQRVLCSLRSFYAWGVLTDRCRLSPLSGVSVAPPKVRGPQQAPVPPTWVEPMRGFLTWLRAKGQTDNTVDHRRSQVSRFAQMHADPWAVTLADLTRWLSRTDWSPSYKRSVRSALRSFYRWAEIHGRQTTNPARDLDPIHRPRALPRPAPDDVVTAGLENADDRIRLALYIALYSGLRRFEIAKLHTQDIGDTDLRIVGKGGHERLVPIHPELAIVLRAELRRRRDGVNLGTGWGDVVPPENGWLFPSDDADRHLTARHLGKLITRALPPGWTTHTLRHRFATQAYRSTRDLRAVQELLGHSKPEVTAIYAAVPDGALEAAVAGAVLPVATRPM